MSLYSASIGSIDYDQICSTEGEHRNSGLQGQNSPVLGQRRAEWSKRCPLRIIFSKIADSCAGDRPVFFL
ncbi:MAG TPA: hypothetical protein VMW38_04190 [Terriglobia bacterium]|nr:hypothetical protein [Terriglobia bacterium]